MDINQTLNALIAAFLPVVNKQLPQFIVNQGLDPWPEVASGEDTLGKIDLGLCTAKVKAKYTITDMKGLSSLFIESLTVQTVNSSGLPTVTGTMKMSAKLNSDLSAKVGGKVTAKCDGVGDSVPINGKVTARGVTGTANVLYTATITDQKACLTELKVQDLKLDYKDVDAKIDGLGFLNDFLQPLIDLIDSVFGGFIKGELSTVVQDELNKLLKSDLPFCI